MKEGYSQFQFGLGILEGCYVKLPFGPVINSTGVNTGIYEEGSEDLSIDT